MTNKQVTAISVFCGSRSGNDPQFKNAAIELGKTLVKNNISLVYGGGKIGLMGILADAVLQEGGEVTGVIPEFLEQKELAHPDINALHVVKSMHERKELISNISDGFIALPGGLGTMDELFEIVTWAQLGLHNKPCGVLNVNGYYDNIINFLNHSVNNEFIQQEFVDMIVVDDNPKILLQRFFEYKHPEIEKRLELEK
jgi:uncharacterized protein (TIGR00730 family)